MMLTRGQFLRLCLGAALGVLAPVGLARAAGFQITVVPFGTRDRLILDVDGSTTVRAVKEMLAAKTGVPVEKQRLIFAGKQLEDDRTLESYKIQKDSTPLQFLRKL